MNALALERGLLRLEAGDPAVALAAGGPRLRRLLDVAEETGAALGPAVSSLIASEHDRDDMRRAVKVATAQAKAVAALLVATPFVLVPGLSGLTGMDVAGFYGSRVGRSMGVIGTLFVGVGVAAIVIMIARVGRTRRDGGSGAFVTDDEVAELLATALSSGMPLSLAVRTVSSVAPSHRRSLLAIAMTIELDLDEPPQGGVDPLTVLVLEAWHLGAPLVPALRRHAMRQRADQRARVLARVERLPVLLALPTALCLLPGTVLLVGAPIVHAGLVSLAGATST